MNSFDPSLRLTAILLAVLISGIAHSAEKPNLKSAEPKSSSDAEERGSDNNPFTVKVLPAPDAETKAAQEEKHRNDKSIQDEKLADATVALTVVTGVLALFTCGLWVANFMLVKDAKKTADRQAREMKESLRIAEKAANAAERSAEIANKSLSTAQRAFVFGKESNSSLSMVNGQLNGYFVWIVYENSGVTPATHVQCWAELKTVSATVTEDPAFQKTAETGSSLILGPRVTCTSSYLFIPLASMMECWKRQTRIYFWARTEYRDIFDPEVIRHHQQCSLVQPIRDPSEIPQQGEPSYVTFLARGPQNTTG